jgi:hypothetical protein
MNFSFPNSRNLCHHRIVAEPMRALNFGIHDHEPKVDVEVLSYRGITSQIPANGTLSNSSLEEGRIVGWVDYCESVLIRVPCGIAFESGVCFPHGIALVGFMVGSEMSWNLVEINLDVENDCYAGSLYVGGDVSDVESLICVCVTSSDLAELKSNDDFLALVEIALLQELGDGDDSTRSKE